MRDFPLGGVVKFVTSMLGCVWLALGLPTAAIAATIDFEDLPVATVVTTQYLNLGVVFSLLDSPQQGPIIALVGSHALVPSSDYLSGAFDYDIQIDFARPALSASIRVLDAEEPFVVRAYSGGLLVGTAVVQGDGMGPGGPAYIASFAAVPFDRLVVDLTNALGSGAGGPEAYDNLMFELVRVPVPEPSVAAMLFLAAVFLLVAFGFRAARANRSA